MIKFRAGPPVWAIAALLPLAACQHALSSQRPGIDVSRSVLDEDESANDIWESLDAAYQGGMAALAAKDYPQAIGLLSHAADGDYLAAQLALAGLYLSRGQAGDAELGRRWTRKAAEDGDANAQLALALLLQGGRGGPRDDAEAVEWLARASEGGVNQATFRLANAYYAGQGVPQNHAKASELFEASARAGSLSAMYNLGVILRDGQGAPRSLPLAFAWLSLAAAQPSLTQANALAALTRLRSQMSAEELAAGALALQRLAGELRPTKRKAAALAQAEPGPPRRIGGLTPSDGFLQAGASTHSDVLVRNLVGEQTRYAFRSAMFAQASANWRTPLKSLGRAVMVTNLVAYGSQPMVASDTAVGYAGLTIGPQFISTVGRSVLLRPYLTVDATGVDWRPFATSFGAGLNLTRVLDRDTVVFLNGQVTRRDVRRSAVYSRNAELSGTESNLALRVSRRVAPWLNGSLALSGQRMDAAAVWRDYGQVRGALVLNFSLADGLLSRASRPARVSLSAFAARRDYARTDPFIPRSTRRKDDELGYRLSAEAPLSSRLSLTAGFAATNRDSTVTIYKYRNAEGTLAAVLLF